MAEWSPAAGAGTSSFGMSGTNAYALAVQPEEAPAKGSAKLLKWQRLRCELLCKLLSWCLSKASTFDYAYAPALICMPTCRGHI